MNLKHYIEYPKDYTMKGGWIEFYYDKTDSHIFASPNGDWFDWDRSEADKNIFKHSIFLVSDSRLTINIEKTEYTDEFKSYKKFSKAQQFINVQNNKPNQPYQPTQNNMQQ